MTFETVKSQGQMDSEALNHSHTSVSASLSESPEEQEQRLEAQRTALKKDIRAIITNTPPEEREEKLAAAAALYPEITNFDDLRKQVETELGESHTAQKETEKKEAQAAESAMFEHERAEAIDTMAKTAATISIAADLKAKLKGSLRAYTGGSAVVLEERQAVVADAMGDNLRPYVHEAGSVASGVSGRDIQPTVGIPGKARSQEIMGGVPG
jgi:hypothetical protein